MTAAIVSAAADPEAMEDSLLAARIVLHDHIAFEVLMRRHNAKLFRVARAILKNSADAEDAVQESYLAAYRGMGRFQGNSTLSTWLTRIVINQALGRLRTHRREEVVVDIAAGRDSLAAREPFVDERPDESPDHIAFQAQMRGVLEKKIDALPLVFRTVFIMREVEEMSVEETAQCLSIPAATVRSRLHRARAQLRESLSQEMDSVTERIFEFGGARCDRIVARVFEQLQSVPTAARP
jgi:RNA polymerase sigma-70 factor (ECF subfamily)